MSAPTTEKAEHLWKTAFSKSLRVRLAVQEHGRAHMIQHEGELHLLRVLRLLRLLRERAAETAAPRACRACVPIRRRLPE